MAAKLPELRKIVNIHHNQITESLERLTELRDAALTLRLDGIADALDDVIIKMGCSLKSLSIAIKD